MAMPLAPESSAGHGLPDQHFHGERRAGDELLDGAGRDAADAVGLAPVEAEGELVEVGLQVFGLDRAGMRAEQPRFSSDTVQCTPCRLSRCCRSGGVCTLISCGRSPRLLGL